MYRPAINFSLDRPKEIAWSLDRVDTVLYLRFSCSYAISFLPYSWLKRGERTREYDKRGECDLPPNTSFDLGSLTRMQRKKSREIASVCTQIGLGISISREKQRRKGKKGGRRKIWTRSSHRTVTSHNYHKHQVIRIPYALSLSSFIDQQKPTAMESLGFL